MKNINEVVNNFLNLFKNKNSKEGNKSSQKNKIIISSDIQTENNINLTKNQKIMAMFNYGVGGNEVKVDANEAIQEIQGNKTLLVGKLTTDEAINPEIVSGLKTVEDVFRYFSPSITVEHETEDGKTQKEEFKFKNLADFTPQNIVDNSDFLNNLKIDEEQHNKIIRQLRVNKVLRNLLADEHSREELIKALRTVANELEK